MEPGSGDGVARPYGWRLKVDIANNKQVERCFLRI